MRTETTTIVLLDYIKQQANGFTPVEHKVIPKLPYFHTPEMWELLYGISVAVCNDIVSRSVAKVSKDFDIAAMLNNNSVELAVKTDAPHCLLTFIAMESSLNSLALLLMWSTPGVIEGYLNEYGGTSRTAELRLAAIDKLSAMVNNTELYATTIAKEIYLNEIFGFNECIGKMRSAIQTTHHVGLQGGRHIRVLTTDGIGFSGDVLLPWTETENLLLVSAPAKIVNGDSVQLATERLDEFASPAYLVSYQDNQVIYIGKLENLSQAIPLGPYADLEIVNVFNNEGVRLPPSMKFSAQFKTHAYNVGIAVDTIRRLTVEMAKHPDIGLNRTVSVYPTFVAGLPVITDIQGITEELIRRGLHTQTNIAYDTISEMFNPWLECFFKWKGGKEQQIQEH